MFQYKFILKEIQVIVQQRKKLNDLLRTSSTKHKHVFCFKVIPLIFTISQCFWLKGYSAS